MAYLYGLLQMPDLADQRVTEVGVDTVVTAIDRSVQEHNRQMDALLDFFVRRTTDFKTRFWSPVTARLQPLDNSGRALPIKPAGKYDVGLPLQMGGTAWGHDYVTGQYMTVAEVARITAGMLDADMRWLRDHLLAALFVDGSWTFVDDSHGSLTVYGLASGDTVTYSILSGADSEATDDHVLGTAALTASTFSSIYTELMEHPENGGDVVVFISSADQSTVEGLSTFIAADDPDIRPAVTSPVLAGTLGRSVPGDVIGKIEKCWIVVWRSLPSNYLVAVTTEGEKPLAMREDAIASLRGFKQVAVREDHPWYERQYLRRAGFGAWNRTGALVYRTNNGTYAVPTGYGSPMG